MTKEEIQAQINVLQEVMDNTGWELSEDIKSLKNELKTSKSIFDLAPDIIHNRLCSELVKLAKKHSGKKAKDVPEWINLLATIETIEQLYPETAAI
jgi:hypothetical protein